MTNTGASRATAPVSTDPDSTSTSRSRDLVPVRLTEDRRRLILVDEEGAEHSVALGPRLRTVLEAVRQDGGPAPGASTEPVADRPAAEQGETKVRTSMESALRPRDIQQRIRAGAAPDEVAEVAGMPVDRVMLYAEPVLAERGHVARTARSASVRRKAATPSSTARTLGAATTERLAEADLDAESAVEWDAWRRPDGRWTLVADYEQDGPRRATFTLDVPGKFVVADDDEARWLVGDGRFALLSRDEEPEIGDDALEMVSADADWIAAPPPAPAEPEPEPAPRVQRPPSPAQESVVSAPTSEDVPLELDPAPETVETGAETGAETGEPAPQRGPKRRGRASVPSWDEIMFGGGPDSA